MLKRSTLKFLSELRDNNNRTWFDAHRNEYETSRQDFLEFANKLIQRIGQWDENIGRQQAKDSMFRIYRDVRFAKDKTPYNSHFSVWLAPGGRWSTHC
ncbi:MAG: DUF2461 domain-containing protein, partial [Bacteroidota bacterium]|nr:DUF2461 domain-containing protein [Bacteroidota bacterium]